MLTVNSDPHDRYQEPTSDKFRGAVFRGDDAPHVHTPWVIDEFSRMLDFVV